MENTNEKNYIMYYIYCCDNINFIYVGSTICFRKRKYRHKSNCVNEKNSETFNLKLYKTIRENGGWNNWKMQPIEIFKCNTKMEARIRENEIMLEMNANLNCRKAFISNDEKKDKNNKNSKKYYNKHNDEEYKNNKAIYDKLYRDNNKQELKERYKSYYENKKEKITCECGSSIYNICKSRHNKTKKHQKYLCGINNNNL